MQSGFSLIELMMVMALIGILSLISYPIYNGYLIRVHRISMAATLLDIAGSLEKYYILHQTYNNASLEKLSIDKSHYKDYYEVSLTPKEDSYTLKAIPIGKQAKDTDCGTLILDQNGNKNVSGNRKSTGCWL